MEEDLTNGGSNGTPPAGSSMMDALRAKWDQLGKSKTIDLDLPGYEGMLIARYHLLDVQTDLNRISTRVSKDYQTPMEQGLFGTIDTMIAACDGLFYRRGEGELVSIGDAPIFNEAGNPPVKFDQRLVEFMGWNDFDVEQEGARGVILRLFQNAEPMLIAHGQQLSIWMMDVSKRRQVEYQGNL